MAVADLRVMGRATQGVRLINLRENDSIAAVTKVEADEAVDEVEITENEHTVPPSESIYDTFPVEEDSDSEEPDSNEENSEEDNGKDIASED